MERHTRGSYFPKEGNMKVQITKCRENLWWYNKVVGESFLVKQDPDFKDWYILESDSQMAILKSDCIILTGDEHMPSHIRKVNEILDEVEETIKDAPGGSTPSQYGLPDNSTDLQDLIEHRDMNFAIGNIFKACYRQGNCSHSDALRDINKIIWFAERELKRLTND